MQSAINMQAAVTTIGHIGGLAVFYGLCIGATIIRRRFRRAR